MYLAKRGFVHAPRYRFHHPDVFENEQSIFDTGVVIDANPQVRQYIHRQKQKLKEVTQSSTNPSAYFRQTASRRRPWWADFWDIQEDLFTSNVDCLVVFTVADRMFLVSHGQGRYLINPACIEVDFGLRVALNVIDPTRIKTADLFMPSEVAMRVQKRAGVSAGIVEYDIDVFTTLLKSVAGYSKPEYEELSKSIHGTDSMKFSHDGTQDDLRERLISIAALYESEAYRSSEFAWIDNFRPIKDKTVLRALDERLVEGVNERGGVVLSIPAIFDETLDLYFGFRGVGRRQTDRRFPTVEFEHYSSVLDAENLSVDLEALKRHRMYVFDQISGQEIATYSLYRCLYFETALDRDSHFIESGNWYRVAPSFLDSLTTRLNPVLRDSVDLGLPFRVASVTANARHAGTHKEHEYNRQLAEHLADSGRSCLLDGDMVHINRSQIEICDVLHIGRDLSRNLIHVKMNRGASSLSHLFSQGYVSIEALLDRDFRRAANEKIAESELQFADDFETNRQRYTVVYGIVSKPGSSGGCSLPLFSQINLDHHVRSIRKLGFAVKVAWINAIGG